MASLAGVERQSVPVAGPSRHTGASCLRLRGGGNDGGSIPKRIELVKTALASNKGYFGSSDATMASHVMLRICPLSGLRFGGAKGSEPVVGDRMGRLYRKEAMVEFLLDRERFGENGQAVAGHVRKLSQVETLQVLYNTGYETAMAASHSNVPEDDLDWQNPGAAPFLCPLTQKEISLKTPFVWIDVKNCCHLMSESGLKELTSKDGDKRHCPICDASFTEKDVITLFPSAEVAMKQRMIYDTKVASHKKRKHETTSQDRSDPHKRQPSRSKGPSLVEGSPAALVASQVAAEQARRSKQPGFKVNKSTLTSAS